MSLRRSSRLLSSALATAGLALGGLSIAASPADAASTTAMYTCKPNLPVPSLPPPLNLLPTSFKVPATFSLATLPDALTANVPVPAGLPVVGTFDFSDVGSGGLAGLLPTLGFTLQNTMNTVLGNVPGSAPVAVPLNGAFSQVNNGIATLDAQLGAFTPTGAGDLPIPVPTSFDASVLLGPLGALFSCKLDAGSGSGGIGTLHVSKQGAKIKAHARALTHHKAIVTVKVKTSAGQKAAGQVIAKAHGIKAKTKSLKNGKVRFVLKGLKAGKNKIKIRFLGNSYTNAAKKKVTVKFAR